MCLFFGSILPYLSVAASGAATLTLTPTLTREQVETDSGSGPGARASPGHLEKPPVLFLDALSAEKEMSTTNPGTYLALFRQSV